MRIRVVKRKSVAEELDEWYAAQERGEVSYAYDAELAEHPEAGWGVQGKGWRRVPRAKTDE